MIIGGIKTLGAETEFIQKIFDGKSPTCAINNFGYSFSSKTFYQNVISSM